MALHIINHPRSTHTAIDDCLAIARKGDVLLLIEDGVLSAQSLHFKNENKLKVFALKEDLLRRDILNNINKDINIVDYSGFVELCVLNNPTVSWF
jgi:tRNA 2-thiouridine synthesizing protein B